MLYSIHIATNQGFRYKEPTDYKIWVYVVKPEHVRGRHFTVFSVGQFVTTFEAIQPILITQCVKSAMLYFPDSATIIFFISGIYLQYSSCPSLQKTQLTFRAMRKFEDNSHVGLVRHEKYTARERLLMIENIRK